MIKILNEPPLTYLKAIISSTQSLIKCDTNQHLQHKTQWQILTDKYSLSGNAQWIYTHTNHKGLTYHQIISLQWGKLCNLGQNLNALSQVHLPFCLFLRKQTTVCYYLRRKIRTIHINSSCENLLMYMVHYDKSAKMVSLNFTLKCHFS